MDDSEQLVQKLFIEAATICGEDMKAIERYVAEKVAGMNDDDRCRYHGAKERVLGFRAPAERPVHSH